MPSGAAAPARASTDGSSSEKHVMLSGRFNRPEIKDYMTAVDNALQQQGVKTFMVNCKPGEDFGQKTAMGLYNAWALVIFGTSEYRAVTETGVGYETYKELKNAYERRLLLVPIQLCETWPPKPVDYDGGRHGAALNSLVLSGAIVRVIDKKMEDPQRVATEIAQQLRNAKETSSSGYQDPPAEVPSKGASKAAEVGSFVIIHGLKSAVELNNQRGKLESFVPETGRWRVKLRNGVLKDIKDSNFQLLDNRYSEADPARAYRSQSEPEEPSSSGHQRTRDKADPAQAYRSQSEPEEPSSSGHQRTRDKAQHGWLAPFTMVTDLFGIAGPSTEVTDLFGIAGRSTEAKQWIERGIAGGGTHEGQRFTAAECYAKAIEADREGVNAPLAWRNLGIVGGGVVVGETHSKKDCFLKALDLNPEYANAWIGLGTVGGTKRFTPKECYLKALEFHPKHSMAWNNLGWQGGGTVGGQAYTAMECYQKALQLDPNNKRARENSRSVDS